MISQHKSSINPEVARAIIESHMHFFWSTRYAAYSNDQEDDNNFLEVYKRSRQTLAATPSTVQAAHSYYYENVESADWGSVRLYFVPLGEHGFFVVRTTTDGDDGWIELFGQDGVELGFGRTYIEQIGWTTQEVLRAQVDSGDFPPTLENRYEQTLWGVDSSV